MKITHALEARNANTTITVLRFEDGTNSIRMDTNVPGETPVTGSCRLSKATTELLAKALSQFIEDPEAFKVEDEQ